MPTCVALLPGDSDVEDAWKPERCDRWPSISIFITVLRLIYLTLIASLCLSVTMVILCPPPPPLLLPYLLFYHPAAEYPVNLILRRSGIIVLLASTAFSNMSFQRHHFCKKFLLTYRPHPVPFFHFPFLLLLPPPLLHPPTQTIPIHSSTIQT